MFDGYHQAIHNVPPIEVKEEGEWGNSTSQCTSAWIQSVIKHTVHSYGRWKFVVSNYTNTWYLGLLIIRLVWLQDFLNKKFRRFSGKARLKQIPSYLHPVRSQIGHIKITSCLLAFLQWAEESSLLCRKSFQSSERRENQNWKIVGRGLPLFFSGSWSSCL